MIDLATIPFKQARHYRAAKRERLDWIVIHSMEAAEKGSTAENVAAWWAGPSSFVSSAHYCVDNNSIIQCVRLEDVAFAAPGANEKGIHIELAGYARQTAAEWSDEYSAAMIDRAADLVAALAVRFEIPLVPVGEVQLRAGARGVTTHYDVTKAFKKSSHRDPGPHFPMDHMLAKAFAARAGA